MSQLDLLPSSRSYSEEDDLNRRFTPRELMLQLHHEFCFTLDACSEPGAPSSGIIGRYFTRTENGLARAWRDERVWCNPPFDDCERWVHKASIEMHYSRPSELVVMLVPAVRTEQPWWQERIERYRDGKAPAFYGVTLSTRFLAKRIRFGNPGDPEGDEVGSPPFGCVLLIWQRTV